MKSIPAAILDVSAPHSESGKSNGHGASEADLGVVGQSFPDLLSVQTLGPDGKAQCKNGSTEQDGNLSKRLAAQSPPKLQKAEEERQGRVSIGVAPLPVVEVFGAAGIRPPSHASLERDVAARAPIERPLLRAANDLVAGDGPAKSGPASAEAYFSVGEKSSGKIEGKVESSPKMQASSNGAGTQKLPTPLSGSAGLTDEFVASESRRSRDLPAPRSLGEADATSLSSSAASVTSTTAIRDGSGLVMSDLSSLRKESLPAHAGWPQAESAKGGLTVNETASAGPARLTATGRDEGSLVEGSPISAISQAHVVQITPGSSLKASATSLSVNRSGSVDVTALSQAVLRPISAGGGNHTLLVAMHPAELGHLEAVVSLNQNGIQVALMPQTVMGHAALANSVEALRSQLAQGGMNVNISLQDPGSPSGNEARHQRRNGAPARSAQPVNAEGVSSPSLLASDSGQIHLVL